MSFSPASLTSAANGAGALAPRAWWRRIAALAVVVVVATLGLVSVAHGAGTPTLTSDKADYPPGGAVVLSGTGWASGEQVHITVNDDAGQTWSLSSGVNGAPADPVANLGGEFTYAFSLPAWFVASYTATATGPSGTVSTTFTDSAVKTFDQCANDLGSGYPASNPDPGCQWINGNLQQSNSVYNEGDATVQRLALTGLTSGQTYTLVFTYQTSKGGLHAYDYLTTWNHSENWITDLCQGLTACSSSSVSTYPIPTTTPESGGQVFTMYGGSMTNALITMPTSYAGDTTAMVTLTFTASGADSVLWFGAHVASQLDWGNGQGAGSISGSPYHVSLVSLQEGSGKPASLGSMDNQMASGAVQSAGSVKIVKDAVPDSGTDFSFTLANATSTKTFALDDDADPTLSNNVTYNVAPGTWTITENEIPSPWTLTNLNCTGGTFTKSGSTATLTVVSGQTITCTFTNTFSYSDLQVTKTATPAYDSSYTWTIDKSVDKTRIDTTSGGAATFTYTVTATPTPHETNYRVTGTISVHNPNTVPVSGVSLVDSMTGGTCSITGTTAGFTVAAGATATFDYTCTFATKPIGAQTNTATATWTAGQPYGTTGTASGTAPADFAAATVNITGGQTTVITDDKTDPANPVILGTADALVPSTHTHTYSITKTAPTGSCIDYINTASLSTGGSDSVTVTLCGSQGLTVSKTATASFNRDWDWVVTKTRTGDGRIYADADGNATATYTVTATPTKIDSGWAVKGNITVVNPNGVAVTGLAISDSMTGSPSCALDAAAPTSIAANSSLELAYTCTYSQAPPTGTLTNTVDVAWATSGHVPSGSQSATATTTFDNLAPASETDTSLTLTDVASDWDGGSITVNASDGVLTDSYSHTWNVGTAGTCQTFTNTVTAPGLPDAQASVEVCRAADLTVTKTASGSLTRTYAWSIDKSLGEIDADVPAGTSVELPYSVVVTSTGHTDSAFKVTGSITVTNPNTWQPVTLTGVSDVLGDGTSCTILTGDVHATLAANGGSEPYTYECVYSAGASPAYAGTNTATATWSKDAAHTANGSANGSDDYSLTDTVTPVRDTVTVTDTMSLDGVAGATGTLGTVTLVESPKTFTDPRSVTAPTGSCVVVTNEAELVETGATAGTTKRICGYAAITSSKSAAGAFARAWDWDIAKDATETRIVADPATGQAVAEYTVTVTPTKTDSGAVVTGTITVTNPNDIALPVTITDTIGDVTCAVTGGTTVPAKASLTVDYSCSLTSVPTGVVTNTAHVVWDATGYVPGGSADPTANVDFATIEPAVTGDGVTFTDPNAPAASYGPFNGAEGVKAVTYSHTWAGTPGTCVDKINTATLSTGLSDDATVTVCREAPVTAVKTGQLDYDRDWTWTIVKDAADTTLAVDPATGTAKATYTVTVTPTKTEGGAVVTGTITVTNPIDVALPVTVTDILGAVTCSVSYPNGQTVPANGSLEVTYRCELGAVPTTDVVNTATISWVATDYIAAGSVSPTATIKASDFTAHVTGQTITVSDPEAPGGTLGSFDAEQGPKSPTYDVEWSGTPGTCVDYPNTATIDQTTQSDSATVTVCQAAEVTATKTGDGAFTRTWSWTADKTVTTPLPIYADPATGRATVDYQVVVTPSKTDSTAVVTGTITVTNPNRVALTATVGDTMADATCTLTTTDRTIPAATDAGPGVLTVGYSCALDSVPTGTVTNTADITWAATEYVPAGHLTPSAVVDFAAATITEVNTSTTVSDPVAGWADNTTVVSDTSKPTTLNYSHTWTVDNAGTCQKFDNTATLTPGTGDSAQVEICRGADLVVTKTAAGSLTRTYGWSIDKTVGDFDGNVPAGTSVDIPYTVSVNGAGHTDSAWQVAGTITVKNPNTWQAVTLTNVSDALSVDGASCQITSGDVTGTIAAGASASFDYVCTYAAQPAAYTGTNTATATWDAAAAHTPNGTDSGDAAYDLASSIAPVNDTVHVTDAFNGGVAEALGTVSIHDTLPTSFPVSRTVQAPAGSCVTVNNTATITETKVSDDAQATVCGGLGLTVTKTATAGYGLTYPWTITKDASRTEILVAEGGDTSVTYTVKATAGAAYPSSWTLTGTITVSNPNDWQAISATVTDTVDIDGVTCTIDGASTVSVPRATGGQPGTAQVTYTCTLASGTNPGTWDGTNTATATWSADDASTATGSATGTAPVTGTQTGATNASVTVTDTLGGDTVTLGTVDADGTLHPAAGIGTADGAFTYTKALTGTPGQCDTIDNTATITQTGQSDDASVQLCIVKDVSAVKTGAGSFTRSYPWTITKDVDQTTVAVKPDGTATFSYTVTATPGTPVDSDHVLSGTVTVTNPNTFAVSATVADGLSGCTYPNGATVSVPAGGSADVAYTCPVGTTLDTNTATVTWTATTDNGSLGGTTSATATGIQYTETGSVDKDIEVWDNKTGSTPILLGTAAWGDGSTPVKFTYLIDKAGSATTPGTCSTYDNEAWVKTAYNDSKDTEQVEVCVGADLSVTKTATTSYARDYHWTIAKKLADDTLQTPAGTPATADYTVTVSKDGWTDSAWTLSGTITVANPNTWQDVVVDITDSVDIGGGAVCTVVGGAAVSVPRSDSVTVDYSCTFTGQPAYTGTNTATATWDGAQAHTASSSDDGTAGVSYGDPATGTHRTITVTDTPEGGDEVTLGTLDYLDAPDSTDYTYSAQFAGTAGTCTDYDNTAEITETGQTATATVKVCVGADLTVTKTAAGGFTRTYLWSIDKSVVDDSITVPAGTNASVDYRVTVSPDGYADSAWLVTGTITVSNPNDWESITATVTESGAGIGVPGMTCTVGAQKQSAVDVTVAPGASVDVGYECTGTPTAYDTSNVVKVTWDKATASTPTGEAIGTKSVTLGQSSVNDTVTITDTPADGSTVTLGTASLSGITPANGITKVDDWTFGYTKAYAGVAGTCTAYDNTAKILETGQADAAKVQVCVAADMLVAKTAAGSYTRTIPWTVTKVADSSTYYVDGEGTAHVGYTVTATPSAPVDSAWTLVGDITVTNPNDFQSIALTGVSDLPSVGSAGTCTFTGDTTSPVVNGQARVLHYECTFASAPAYTSGTNVATVTWDMAAASTPGGAASSDAVAAAFAETVSIDYQVPVSDPQVQAGPLGTAIYGQPGTYTYQVSIDWPSVPGSCVDYTNTATIDVSSGADPSDSETVQVCAGADLWVTQTANTSFARDYDWTITKSVDDDRVEIAQGGTATSSYDVVVDKGGYTDSAWSVTGTITVHNPNPWAVQASVSDSVDIGGGATCLVAGQATESVNVLAHDSVDVAYVCTFASQPAYTGVNTASITWDADAAHTAGSSDTGTADVTFGAPATETDRTVTVDDVQAPAGTFTALDYLDSALPATFTYSVTRDGVAGTCTAYPNTATITETDGVRSSSASVTVCVGSDLTVEKTAAGGFTRTYLWSIDKSVVDDSITVPAGTNASVDYRVTVSPDGYADSAQALGGTITVSNPNDWQDISATVTDVVDIAGVTCTITETMPVSVPQSGSVTLHYSCTGDYAGDYAGTNTATATWDAAVANTPTGTAAGSADFTMGQTSVNQSVTVTDTPADGSPVTLGTADWFTGITPADRIAKADEWTFGYTKAYAGVSGTCTAYDNTATITATNQTDNARVTVCVGADVTVTKDGAGSYTRTYLWTIAKEAEATQVNVAPNGDAVFDYTVTATPAGYNDSAWTMAGTITVTNPNDFQSVTVDVTDLPNVGGGATCAITDGVGVVLAPKGQSGDSVTLAYTCSVPTKPDYTDGSNTATATVTAGVTPTASVTSAAAPIAFTEGTSVDKSVDVYDDKTVSGGQTLLGSVTWNAAGTATPFTYSVTQKPTSVGSCTDYTNTAWIDLQLATDPTATKTVKACVGAALTVTKTATATFTRTYLWTIAKTTPNPAPPATLNSTLGVPYTVTVTPNGYEDSAWTTTGTITVTNPNDWEAVTVTSVTDALDSSLGGTCTVTGLTATNAVLAKGGGSVTVNYSCTYSAKPSSYSGTNTATATWDAAAAFTTNGSASGQTPVNFALTKEVNKTVTVTDQAVITGTTTGASATKTLGTATWNADGTPTVFIYTNTYSVPKNGCTSYTNTATITATGQTATAVVKVCGPPWIGDGTIGFWQNKNGQAIITGGAYTKTLVGTKYVNVCNVTTWLRQFAPFQDLSATATCTQVASYASNVIKAANASGATMNAMLKAQMLAAALNYYYTTIEPRRSAPLGSLSTMTFDISPWSGAFGGATSMTLLQMLTYAATTPSPYGSSTNWYGQDKILQGLAKDAFAAINMSRILIVG